MSYTLNGKVFDTVDEFMEAYFERAAIALLSHSEDRPSYFINYETDDVSEIETALGKNLQLPALVLDSPDDVIMNRSDRLSSRFNAAITVIDKYTQGDAKSLKASRNRCRGILRKIIMKMMRDSMKQFDGVLINNFIFSKHEEIPGMYLGKTGGLFTGWTYEIAWEIPENMMNGELDW